MEKESIIGKYYKYKGPDGSWKRGDIYLVAKDGTIPFDIIRYQHRCDSQLTYSYIIEKEYFEPATEEEYNRQEGISPKETIYEIY